MTNQIAIAIIVLILAALAADHLWLGFDLPIRVLRLLDGVIEYLSFWR